jgi:hypothetical protein
MKRIFFCLILYLFNNTSLWADTLTPKDFAWLAGDWRSTDQNGIFEEHWSKLISHNMVGVSRLVNSKGQAIFFELMTIDNLKNWEMRIRHFGPHLAVLKDDKDVLVYRLIQHTSNQFIFENIGDDPVRYIIYQNIEGKTLWVSLKTKNNETKEKFEFTKY